MDDAENLINEAKLRFAHNNSKAYLKDKYSGKLFVANQDGLWNANLNLISILKSQDQEFLVLLDEYQNPVKVNRLELLNILTSTYNSVMEDWLNEYTKLKDRR